MNKFQGDATRSLILYIVYINLIKACNIRIIMNDASDLNQNGPSHATI